MFASLIITQGFCVGVFPPGFTSVNWFEFFESFFDFFEVFLDVSEKLNDLCIHGLILAG